MEDATFPLSQVISQEETKRYQRQVSLPIIGLAGQIKLKNAKIALIGIGGLGCPAAIYLTAAGIGHLAIFDSDNIEISNLGRQVLFTESDLKLSKTSVAAQKLSNLNSQIRIEAFHLRVDQSNALKLLTGYDLILDCTDHIPTKYLLSDVSTFLQKPLISASVYQQEIRYLILNTQNRNRPCYRCLFPFQPLVAGPSCMEAGVLGPACGIAGTRQALWAIELIVSNCSQVDNKYLIENTNTLETNVFSLRQRVDCLCNHPDKLLQLIQAQPKSEDEFVANKTLSMSSFLAHQNSFELIDIRTVSEFQADHIKNARNIPLKELVLRQSELKKNATVVIYCQSGKRSTKALWVLKDFGIENILQLEGGFTHFKNCTV